MDDRFPLCPLAELPRQSMRRYSSQRTLVIHSTYSEGKAAVLHNAYLYNEIILDMQPIFLNQACVQ
jgi:hypothetical protein